MEDTRQMPPRTEGQIEIKDFSANIVPTAYRCPPLNTNPSINGAGLSTRLRG